MKKRRLFLIITCFAIICMAFTACRKNKNQDVGTDGVTITPTITPSQSEPDSEGGQSNEDTDTGESEDETNTNSSTEYISDSEAVKRIQNEIGERGYFIELLDDHLNIGQNEYYVYQISDSSTIMEPNVLVDKISGELLCYYPDGSTAPFSEFPLFTDANNSEDENTTNEFTKEDALAQLSKVSAKILDLPVELTEYTIRYDDWTTNVQGVECYGINAFSDVGERMINMGIFYVAVDGSIMFKFDSMMDDFVEIKIE